MSGSLTTIFVTTKIFRNLLDLAKKYKSFSKPEKEYLTKSKLREYLDSCAGKFNTTKTILRGATPVYFYEIFFHLRLRKIDADNTLDFETISANLFFEMNQKTVFIGEAGSGKSTILKHFFLRCIKEQYKIPLFVELRYHTDPSENLLDFTRRTIFGSEDKQGFDRIMKSGTFLFLWDGFDEIMGSLKSQVSKDIELIAQRFEKNIYCLTSRPYSNAEMISGFTPFQIQNLNDEEVGDFIRQQLTREPDLADEIIFSIKKSEASHFQSFLMNPLLLSLFMLTFQSNATIPTQKHIFYRRVVNTLFSEHDSRTKIGYQRHLESGLSQEQFEKILKAFSIINYAKGLFVFDYDSISSSLNSLRQKFTDIEFSIESFISDMKTAISLWVEDGLYVSFAHRSLQEYFAALFLKDLYGENKEVLYSKIRAGSMLNHSEVFNFLSLCEEMDPHYFNKYIKIPVLNELISKVDENNIVESYFAINSMHLRAGSGSAKSAYLVLKYGHEEMIYDYVAPMLFSSDLAHQVSVSIQDDILLFANREYGAGERVSVLSDPGLLSKMVEGTSKFNLSQTLKEIRLELINHCIECESRLARESCIEKSVVDLI